MSDQCLFCGIVAGNVPNVKVAEDDTTYAFMDINPGSDGHILVIPKRHSKDLFEIPTDDLTQSPWQRNESPRQPSRSSVQTE